MSDGSPQTLIAAIQAGISDYHVHATAKALRGDESHYIQQHVLDFLRRRFGNAYLSTNPDVVRSVESLARSIGVGK